MALLIVGQIAAGVWMSGAIHEPNTKALAFNVYQLHKSIGLTVLLLTLLRLLWRFTHTPPALPAHMKNWERMLARISHLGFYLLMIAIPLSGWAMVSASPFGLPTIYFGWFEWPHIAPLAALANKPPAEQLLKELHEVLAIGIVGLLVLHVGGALKHHFIDKDNVLARMLPWVRQR